MSWLYIALLALALAVVSRSGVAALRRTRRESMRAGAVQREKRKATFRIVPSEADDFAASVERDLAQPADDRGDGPPLDGAR